MFRYERGWGYFDVCDDGMACFFPAILIVPIGI